MIFGGRLERMIILWLSDAFYREDTAMRITAFLFARKTVLR